MSPDGFCEDAAAIAAERQPLDPTGVSLEDDGTAGPKVPELHPPVHTSAGELLPIGPEGDGMHEVGMAMEGAHVTAGWHLPELDAAILAAGSQEPTVGTEGQAEDESLVTEDRPVPRSSRYVPERDRPVPAARGQPLPVRTERHAIDPARVPLEIEKPGTGLDVPHLDDVGTGHRQPFAFGIERHLVHAPLGAG